MPNENAFESLFQYLSTTNYYFSSSDFQELLKPASGPIMPNCTQILD